MDYKCNMCNLVIEVVPEGKTKCSTCGLIYNKVHVNAAHKEVAGSDHHGSPIAKAGRQVRDMR